ncbi:MAG: DUF268 domain-containing protein [Synergistaceae bacterium]|nr:DUF268 domain-containing protein [Synergistaceae bacterium]
MIKDFIKKFVRRYRILPVYWLYHFLKWVPLAVKYNVNYFSKLGELTDNRFESSWSLRWPCLYDATPTTGFDPHYIYHTSWAARVVVRINPEYHVDLSSSLYFVSIASAFIPVRCYDYRPAEIRLTGLECGRADITNLPFEDNSIKSLSCMHVMEHIGLGRYGDPFDPKGDLRGISEMIRVLAPEGNLLFVVPVGGVPKLQFNAHRIYTYRQIKEYFRSLELEEFSLVTDKGSFVENASEDDSNQQAYGCGCFWFKKTAKAN